MPYSQSPWDEASLAESVNSGLGRAPETLSLNIMWKAVEDDTDIDLWLPHAV